MAECKVDAYAARLEAAEASQTRWTLPQCLCVIMSIVLRACALVLVLALVFVINYPDENHANMPRTTVVNQHMLQTLMQWKGILSLKHACGDHS